MLRRRDRVAAQALAGTVLCVALGLVAAACGTGRQAGSGGGGGGVGGGRAEPARRVALPSPAFLSLVPADATFVYAALEAPPEAFVAREVLGGLAALEPVWRALRGRPAARRQEVLAQLDLATRGRLALLEVTGGKADTAALAAIGLDPRARYALHGHGAATVLRVELSDPDRFGAALERMAPWLAPAEPTAIDGTRALRVSAGGRSWLVAVIGPHLVLAAPLGRAGAALERELLGLQPPARSLAGARALDRVAAELGASPAGLGYVDLVQLARAAGAAMPAPCGEEMAALAALMPRISIGLRGATRQRTHYVSAIEARRDVADALLALRGSVPLADPDLPAPGALVALAIDLGAAVGLLERALDRIVQQPFRCGALEPLNRLAREQAPLLRTAGSMALGGVRGASALILTGEAAAAGRGAAASAGAVLFIGSEDPPSLLARLAGLGSWRLPPLTAGQPPVEVQGAALLPLSPVHVALASRAVGISLGGHDTLLAELIAAPPPSDPPLLLVRLAPRDAGPLLDLLGRSSPPPVAAVDPEIGSLLAAADGEPLSRYEEVSFTVRASSRGLEISFAGRAAR